MTLYHYLANLYGWSYTHFYFEAPVCLIYELPEYLGSLWDQGVIGHHEMMYFKAIMRSKGYEGFDKKSNKYDSLEELVFKWESEQDSRNVKDGFDGEYGDQDRDESEIVSDESRESQDSDTEQLDDEYADEEAAWDEFFANSKGSKEQHSQT